MTSSLSFWQDVQLRFFRNPAAVTGLFFLALLLLLALLVPLLSPYSYYEIDLAKNNQPPSSAHWFGTDELGRDLFTRVWWGARISLFVGIAAALIDLFFGVLWGGVAGFFGGKIDIAMMHLADLLYGIPYVLVVICLLVVLGPGLLPILLAMTFIGWVPMARMVRGQVLSLLQQEYVLAARVLGASSSRILLRHLIPNMLGPILVTTTLTIPTAIFLEAFLSFLGLGVQAPLASLGTLASDGLPAFTYCPWRLYFPGLVITAIMLSFNFVGDGLRDAVDPKMERRRA